MHYFLRSLLYRFCRLRQYNTLYICGTDEYGTATETKVIILNVITERQACKDENIVTTVIRQYADKEKPCNGEKVLMVLWSFRLTFLICKIMHELHTKHSA